MKYKVVVYFIFLFSYSSAEESSVLNFEVDIIQAEAQSPRMFVEVKEGDTDLEAILFMREDFNDFFQVDWKRRPKFFEGTK